MSIAASTLWFLVVINTSGDQDVLDRMPVVYPTQQVCVNEAVALMIDRRGPLTLNCIEADNEDDLVIIMNQAFNFGGEGV